MYTREESRTASHLAVRMEKLLGDITRQKKWRVSVAKKVFLRGEKVDIPSNAVLDDEKPKISSLM